MYCMMNSPLQNNDQSPVGPVCVRVRMGMTFSFLQRIVFHARTRSALVVPGYAVREPLLPIQVKAAVENKVR